MSVHEIVLGGCTPEPLMGYLKALGVLRLVAEQKDRDARGCWRDGVFVLTSNIERDDLVRFLLEEYRPTPIVVPWSGADFFGVNSKGDGGPFKKTPTSTAVVEAFLASKCSRLAPYRETIRAALSALASCGIENKTQMEDKKAKSRFMSCLRSQVAEDVVAWVDTCAVMSDEKASFSSLLGSGGGSDGNTHFSDNFMQNLWEVLPEFDDQKVDAIGPSGTLLASAIFDEACTGLVPKRTSTLFDPGAVGGPNAGQGFERVSLGNPWSIILCLEGTILLAGCVARRHGGSEAKRAAFPFQVRLTPTRTDSASDRESAGREIWMPLWSHSSSAAEVGTLFSEGRASIGASQAERGVDFARAVAGLGVDRGIEAFHRFAVVRGRVGGENYNTSTVLGRFEVRARQDVHLLREADGWLDRFRGAASADQAPPRFTKALRAVESAIFEYCQHGGAPRFADILCTLGRAEREVANGEKFREDKHLKPLAGLSPQWIQAGHDGSVEFELALALSSIFDTERKIGPLRANLESVVVNSDRHGRVFPDWAKKEKAVVWTSADLSTNLASVLSRRLMDANRKGCESLPLFSHRSASLDAVAKFIAGEVDEEKTEALLWGLMLIDQTKPLPSVPHWRSEDCPPLPRSYALFKLLFLPFPIAAGEGDVVVRCEAGVLPLLRAGRIGDACSIAARRLRASGLVPLPHRTGRRTVRDNDWNGAEGTVDPRRLGAALLFPVDKYDVNERLAALVLRRGEQPIMAVLADGGKDR
jgi:CRISPR-associated protein Csx17